MVCAHCGSAKHCTGCSNCTKYCTLCKQAGHQQRRSKCPSRECSKWKKVVHSACECRPTVPQHDESINISHDLHADRTDEYSRETSEPDVTQSLSPSYVVRACSNKDDDRLTTICAHCSSVTHRNRCSECPNVCTLCNTAGHRQKRGAWQFRECSNCKAVGHAHVLSRRAANAASLAESRVHVCDQAARTELDSARSGV